MSIVIVLKYVQNTLLVFLIPCKAATLIGHKVAGQWRLLTILVQMTRGDGICCCNKIWPVLKKVTQNGRLMRYTNIFNIFCKQLGCCHYF